MAAHQFVDGVCQICHRSALVLAHFRMSCIETVGPSASLPKPQTREYDQLDQMIKEYVLPDSQLTHSITQPTTSEGKDDPHLWVSIGRAAWTRQDWSEVIKALRNVLRLRPRSVAAWKALGHAYHMEECPKNVDASEHRQAKERRGEVASREAVRLQPDDPEAWAGLGDHLGYRAKYDETIHAYHEALRLGENSSSLWERLGEAYSHLEQYANAIAAFRETLRVGAVEHFIGPPGYLWGKLAQAYRGEGQYLAAASAKRCALRLGDASAVSWTELGDLYVEQGKPLEAVEAFQQATRAIAECQTRGENPIVNTWETWMKLGDAHEALGQHAKAVTAYDKAIAALHENRPDEKADRSYREWAALGRMYDRQGKAVAAAAAYEKAIVQCKANRREPPNAADEWRYLGLGRVYKDQGKYAEAIAAHKQALALNPGKSDAAECWASLGVTYGRAGQHQDAFLAFCEAVEAAPHVGYAQRGFRKAYGRQSIPTEAVRTFRECCLSARPDACGWHCLAVACDMRHLVPEAVDAYRKVVELTPDDPWAWVYLGEALQAGGEHVESIAALRKAIELKRDYVEAFYGLGKASATLGERTQLMETYEMLRILDSAVADEFFEQFVLP